MSLPNTPRKKQNQINKTQTNKTTAKKTWSAVFPGCQQEDEAPATGAQGLLAYCTAHQLQGLQFILQLATPMTGTWSNSEWEDKMHVFLLQGLM